jgi:hypothetical protein
MDQAAAEIPRKSGRFIPGHSGNPIGPSIANPRIAELYGVMAADYEGLTGVERVQLRAAARLFDRSAHTKNPDIAVRAAALAQRILATLQTKKRKRAGRPPLREQLAAQFATK